MAAYLNPKIVNGKLVGWDTTSSASDWFAIGYNDPGSTDRDFDDLMAVGHITAVPGPIVGAGLPGFRFPQPAAFSRGGAGSGKLAALPS